MMMQSQDDSQRTLPREIVERNLFWWKQHAKVGSRRFPYTKAIPTCHALIPIVCYCPYDVVLDGTFVQPDRRGTTAVRFR